MRQVPSHNWMPTQQYIVAVKRGQRTRFFYGEKLKEACAAAHLKDGERFTYRLFKGAPKRRAHLNGTLLVTH